MTFVSRWLGIVIRESASMCYLLINRIYVCFCCRSTVIWIVAHVNWMLRQVLRDVPCLAVGCSVRCHCSIRSMETGGTTAPQPLDLKSFRSFYHNLNLYAGRSILTRLEKEELT